MHPLMGKSQGQTARPRTVSEECRRLARGVLFRQEGLTGSRSLEKDGIRFPPCQIVRKRQKRLNRVFGRDEERDSAAGNRRWKCSIRKTGARLRVRV